MADETPSRLSRMFQLGAMTGRVATSYVREQVRTAIRGPRADREELDKLHIDNARDIAQVMSRMKGAAMKLGQQVAVLAESMDLPKEVSEALSSLHNKADPIPMRVIREEIERSLEAPLEQRYAWFDPNPLGTASLAQAHAARLPDGREVVVKVLHRGVAASVDTDLLALKGILISQAVGFRRSKEELDEIFDEIRARLLEELDYLQEAANIDAYHRAFGNDPRLHIPRVHPCHSTENVLTMDRVPGVPLDLFLDMGSEAAKQRAGLTMAEFYYEQLFRHRMIHGDPHPGNYLFTPDGRVGVLDFGCVKRFDEYWLARYARIALAALADDRAAALESSIEIGAWDGKDPAAGEVLWQFILAMTAGFRSGEVTLGGEGERLMEGLMPAAKALIGYPSLRAPRDVIFLHRSLGGLYGINRKLKLRHDFGALLQRHATWAVETAEGRRPA